MLKKLWSRRQTLVIGAGCLASPWAAHASDVWPSKQLTIVSPYPAGGITDLLCRIVADELSKALGQAVVVENRTGASGAIGHTFVAKAPADGHTILFTSPAHYLNTSLYKKLPYDADKDFRAVTKISNAQLVL